MLTDAEAIRLIATGFLRDLWPAQLSGTPPTVCLWACRRSGRSLNTAMEFRGDLKFADRRALGADLRERLRLCLRPRCREGTPRSTPPKRFTPFAAGSSQRAGPPYSCAITVRDIAAAPHSTDAEVVRLINLIVAGALQTFLALTTSGQTRDVPPSSEIRFYPVVVLATPGQTGNSLGPTELTPANHPRSAQTSRRARGSTPAST